MHIALCDDDIVTLQQLSQILDNYRANADGEGTPITYEIFTNPHQLEDAVRTGRFDLLILDIIMPELSGMTLAGRIRSWNDMIPIIFLTSSPEFALASYRVHVQDYLLKPIDANDLYAVLHRQMRLFSQQSKTLVLRTSNGVLQVPISDIVCVESVLKKLLLTQTDGTVREATGTLFNCAKTLLEYPYFYRPHRSYLVNLRHVETLEKDGLRMNTGTFIPVPRNVFATVKNHYLNYMLSMND